jgi:hypothetical protein
MPRIKKVFSNHAEVCHIWAQQTQEEGRAGNIFFHGDKIYSYGLHFTAAKIHTVKGVRFALVNSHRYSTSTGQHLNYIASALNGLMQYFSSPDVSDPKAAILHLDQLAQDQIKQALKRMKITNKDSIKWELKGIHNYFSDVNRLRKIMGRKEVWPTKKQLDEVEKHLKKRLARYHELNTPEMIAKREVDKQKREANKTKLEEKKLAEAIEAFRTGYFYQPDKLRSLPYDLLRFNGDRVETSRGARVPLKEARILYRSIKSGKDVMGEKIGDYTLIRVTPIFNPEFEDDKLVQIGCHKILLSEAAKLFSASHLKLVEGVA